ncbi:disease resistance protein TAO1-like [Brassica napus]|uniref:disease resistance protein TAO1-like n=1 Tax=Brassica napus TaxID=3708 RepID=UPI002078A2FE|nr:disease resistance protein TAO1-like [Brassica napus]
MDFSLFLTIVAAAIGFFVIRRFRFNPENNEIDTSSLSPSSPPSSLSSLSLSTSSTPSSLSISSSSPSSSSHVWIHDVFPSFRGEDVRKDFLSHVQKEFKRKGITLFNDNGIKRGESIGPELIRGIRESKIAIVFLSKNYASSKWCLEELAEIMKCREELRQTVMAIFYKVDPSDVKKLTGDFGSVFRKTCEGKGEEDIGRWKQALEKVATIAGYHSYNWDNEASMVETIASDVSNELFNFVPSRDFEVFVGMRAHMINLKPLLLLGTNEVRMIGIWGPSGIGKSTIARVLFNQHSHQFPFSVFMEEIKIRYRGPYYNTYSAKIQLQKEFLSQLINQKDIEIHHLEVVSNRLKGKKVFVVLDDVDHLLQLQAVAEKAEWFGPGSIIVITTQDKKLLTAHEVKYIYEVELPPDKEALEIFCRYAFGQKYPPDGFKELAWEVTNLAGKLPLGLRVMGSHFKGRPKHEWEEGLPRLRTRLDGEIESTLKFSYDALCDDNQAIFLHLACFLKGELPETVERCLEKNFVGVKGCLRVLAEKSFIYFEWGCIKMHDLLALLGREIVRKKSIHEPGQRQFLVDAGDICQVLRDDALGSRNVIGIDLVLPKFETELKISDRVFKRMPNVQFLRVKYHSKPYPHSIDPVRCLPSNLRILDWDYFPMTCLPSNFNPEFLVKIILTKSNFLEKLWEGNKTIRNLRSLDLNGSKNLKELPNLSTATNLQSLSLFGCSSLTELPFSIGNAINLRRLDLSHCSSLVEFPSSMKNVTTLEQLLLYGCVHLANLPPSIGNLKKLYLHNCSSLVELPSSVRNSFNLKTFFSSGCSNLVELPLYFDNANGGKRLNLSGCSSLRELPSSIGNMTNLMELDLSGCSSLRELSSSIGNITSLEKLYLNGCSSLVELSSSIGNMTNLMKLYLRECSSLRELPSSIGNMTNLEELNLIGCSSLVELPSSIGNMTNLMELDLRRCSSLRELPSSIGNITSLEKLYLNGCSSLVELSSSIGNMTSLMKLYMRECSSLRELPSSIGNMTNLEELNLIGCTSLVELPSSIGNMANLMELDLRRCSSLVEFPSSIGNMTSCKELNLNGCSSLVELSSSIGNMTSLEELNLNGCSSFVKLPSSVGDMSNLRKLYLENCSNLTVLPININMKSLDELVLTDCSSLKLFPEISTNIRVLKLSGTAIEELPPSIMSWPRLRELVIKGCTKLVSLPQLPDSLEFLVADNCGSLERLDCSFNKKKFHALRFVNCFKLNQEARDLIINTSTRDLTILPGETVPTYFSYRATGSSLSMTWNGLDTEHFPTSLRFKACILVVYKGEVDAYDWGCPEICCCITDELNGVKHYSHRWVKWPPTSGEHLFVFEIEDAVSAPELVFEFEYGQENWEIKECWIHPLETLAPSC